MKLAEAIKSADDRALKSLASYLVSEFEIQANDFATDKPVPVEADGIKAAMSAWAYMQLNAQDQGD